MTETETETEKKDEGKTYVADTRSEIEKLRDEFTEQFATLKTSYEKTAAEQKETIEKLTKENQDLQRALIRSVTIDPQPTSHEPTAEELYQKKIDELSKKSLTIMKNRG